MYTNVIVLCHYPPILLVTSVESVVRLFFPEHKAQVVVAVLGLLRPLHENIFIILISIFRNLLK